MGAAASASGVELMTETESLEVLMDLCKKLETMVSQDEFCTKFCNPVMDKPHPSMDDFQGWKDRRHRVFSAVEAYMNILKKCESKSPADVDQLVKAQGEEEVNLSFADRDDDEVAGNMYVFQLPSLKKIPESVVNLGASLVKLTLKKNSISELPSLASLSGLKELDVSENVLSCVDPIFNHLPGLEVLNCSENSIEQFSDSLGNMTLLKVLIAFKNKLTNLPDSIGQCVNLEEINMFSNKLIKLPKTFGDLENLLDVNVGGNKLKTIPSTAKWKKLERLALSWNNIVMLNDFKGMINLRQLQMNKNSIAEIQQDAFEGCGLLQVVDLSTNILSQIPASMSQCSAIETLDFSSNKLTSMIDMSKMTMMKICKLGQNALTNLDGCHVENCTSLQTLFINANQLERLPEGLLKIEGISRINVGGNPEALATSEGYESLSSTLAARCKENKGKWIT